jgi:hypothetical protein
MKICEKMWTWRRLPTIFELWGRQSDITGICYDSTSCSNAISALSLKPNFYLSSTEGNDYIARQLNMFYGYADGYGKNDVFYVVCVHD